MFEYEFFNSYTGDSYFIIANCRGDAVEEMRNKFPNTFYDWEYVHRKPMGLCVF